MERVTTTDPDLVMPPPATGKRVTAEEVETLRRWIEQGAPYEEHWAFVPPSRPDVPIPSQPQHAQNPLDAFVLARLDSVGLAPSGPAERVALVRRLFLDLTGLPPSPEQVESLLADPSPDAYPRLVDRLLASPEFGERWGRWWLDAARYADSDGYEKDKPRSVWFYRDWTIAAMNGDKPYDQFVIEQIAGDLLPGAGQSERVATGFLRNSMVNEEGGADPEQFRVEGMFDRVDAIGKAVLGITTQCAQCHTHKFDPLTHTEYYRMFAALNDFHEAIMTVYTPEEQDQRKRIEREIAEIERALQQQHPDWRDRMRDWERAVTAAQNDWRVQVPTDIPYEGQKFRILSDGSIISESYAPTKNTATFSLDVGPQTITAIRLDLLKHPQLPRGGPGRSIYGTGALTEFKVLVAPADQPDKQREIKLVRAVADVNPPESRLPSVFREKDGANDQRVTGPVQFAIDNDRNTAWTTDIGPGRRNRNRHAIFIPEAPIELNEKSRLSFQLQQNHGGWNSDDNQNYLLGRYRFAITGDANPSDRVVASDVQPLLRIPEADRTDEEHQAIFRFWRSTIDDFAGANQQIEELWNEYPAGDTQLVVEQREQPRETFVMLRGDFLSPADRVAPGMPEFLNEPIETRDPDRLDFARWLVDRDAPTTARALVNRIWQSYFGNGFVDSPEDLGYQSQPPTHPRLLDWLAVELMENGWSLKHIHRQIVMSATYRQSSILTDELRERDPQNRLLARGPRHRVSAEQVRDIALAASGLLSREVGGPSVYPPAPDFLFEPPASYGPKIWPTSTDGQQYRRSLYVHTYRSVPYPPLQVFDAPKGDAACVRRSLSNTPLQALVLLNEPQFVECARALSARVLRESPGDDRDRLQRLYRLCTARLPDDAEADILLGLLDSQRRRIAAGELDAAAILGTDAESGRQPSGTTAADVAAWTVVARAVLNLDETITKP